MGSVHFRSSPILRECRPRRSAKTLCTLQIPALAASTPPLSSSALHSVPSGHDGEEDKWLSQVEILTHFGPHRRLWMGPQFAFKTFQHSATSSSSMSSISATDHRMGQLEEELLDLDISLPTRPHEQSNPVSRSSNVPGDQGDFYCTFSVSE